MSKNKGNLFTKIKNFFKRAFKDMGESTKAQHEVDKANLEAAKAEAKANFEENRFSNSYAKAKEQAQASWDDAHLSPAERTAKTRESQQKQIEEANARKEQANKRCESLKANKNDSMERN